MNTSSLANATSAAAADDVNTRRAALETDVVAVLDHLGWLRLSGNDVDSFLQGQLSNDLRELQAGRVQLSAWSSAKGRVLALFTAWRDGDAVILETSRELIAPLHKRLRMFVLRAKVVIEDITAQQAALGVAGDHAAERLAALGLPVPAEVGALAEHGDVRIIHRAGARPRYSLHGPEAALSPIRDALAANCAVVGHDAWQLLDVIGGQPSIAPQTQDHFVAQMINVDTLGGISFTKGCYTGQEVIARLHYRGQLKRRMFLCHADTGETPPPGTAIHLAEGDTQAVGEIVAAQQHPDHGCALLAVLQLTHADSDRLRLGAPQGPVLDHPQALV